MTALGHERFLVHGGDMGANIASWKSIDAPERIGALHLTLASLRRPAHITETDPAVQAWRTAAADRLRGETAYQQIMGSKPQTLAYALTDSPVGLAAWILEKMHGWTDPASPAIPLETDALITNIMLYWLAGPGPSGWPYAFYLDGSTRDLPEDLHVTTPTAFWLLPNDIAVPPPRTWVERTYAVTRYAVAEQGGHFPALEQPQRLVDDLRTALAPFRF